MLVEVKTVVTLGGTVTGREHEELLLMCCFLFWVLVIQGDQFVKFHANSCTLFCVFIRVIKFFFEDEFDSCVDNGF